MTGPEIDPWGLPIHIIQNTFFFSPQLETKHKHFTDFMSMKLQRGNHNHNQDCEK